MGQRVLLHKRGASIRWVPDSGKVTKYKAMTEAVLHVPIGTPSRGDRTL